MAWFRNIPTGREFSADGRWADAHRQNADNIEIDAPGADPTPRPAAAVSESDPALKRLRLADLQALCAERGLDTDGSKAALITRLSAIAEEPQ